MNIWKYLTFVMLGLLIWFWMSFTGVRKIEFDNFKQSIQDLDTRVEKLNINVEKLNSHKHKYLTQKIIFNDTRTAD